MKKTIILAAIITASILTGCAGQTAAPKQNSAPQETREPAKAKPTASEPSAPTEPKTEDAAAAYKTLIAHKTENYAKQSVADFNAALVSNPGSPDPLGELLAANAKVSETLSSDDENYDFIAGTMRNSLNELYCEHMGEQVAFFASLSKQSRPSGWLDDEGEIWYEFYCFADLYIDYSISSPELITVAERDNMLITFKEEMQNYLNGLSEVEIKKGDIETMLMDKAAELESSLSTENMKLLSCEISVNIID